MIIHIDGIQGSVKSYLCSKIKMKCVDTDEIIDKAYDIIEKRLRKCQEQWVK